jgi:hypothetical protein
MWNCTWRWNSWAFELDACSKWHEWKTGGVIKFRSISRKTIRLEEPTGITDYALLFFLIGIVGGVVQLGPLGNAATNGLLCQPRVIMMMEKSVEWLAGETEVLGESLPQCRFVHHKPHMLPGREPGPPRWEASV